MRVISQVVKVIKTVYEYSVIIVKGLLSIDPTQAPTETPVETPAQTPAEAPTGTLAHTAAQTPRKATIAVSASKNSASSLLSCPSHRLSTHVPTCPDNWSLPDAYPPSILKRLEICARAYYIDFAAIVLLAFTIAKALKALWRVFGSGAEPTPPIDPHHLSIGDEWLNNLLKEATKLTIPPEELIEHAIRQCEATSCGISGPFSRNDEFDYLKYGPYWGTLRLETFTKLSYLAVNGDELNETNEYCNFTSILSQAPIEYEKFAKCKQTPADTIEELKDTPSIPDTESQKFSSSDESALESSFDEADSVKENDIGIEYCEYELAQDMSTKPPGEGVGIIESATMQNGSVTPNSSDEDVALSIALPIEPHSDTSPAYPERLNDDVEPLYYSWPRGHLENTANPTTSHIDINYFEQVQIPQHTSLIIEEQKLSVRKPHIEEADISLTYEQIWQGASSLEASHSWSSPIEPPIPQLLPSSSYDSAPSVSSNTFSSEAGYLSESYHHLGNEGSQTERTSDSADTFIPADIYLQNFKEQIMAQALNRKQWLASQTKAVKEVEVSGRSQRASDSVDAFIPVDTYLQNFKDQIMSRPLKRSWPLASPTREEKEVEIPRNCPEVASSMCSSTASQSIAPLRIRPKRGISSEAKAAAADSERGSDEASLPMRIAAPSSVQPLCIVKKVAASVPKVADQLTAEPAPANEAKLRPDEVKIVEEFKAANVPSCSMSFSSPVAASSEDLVLINVTETPMPPEKLRPLRFNPQSRTSKFKCWAKSLARTQPTQARMDPLARALCRLEQAERLLAQLPTKFDRETNNNDPVYNMQTIGYFQHVAGILKESKELANNACQGLAAGIHILDPRTYREPGVDSSKLWLGEDVTESIMETMAFWKGFLSEHTSYRDVVKKDSVASLKGFGKEEDTLRNIQAEFDKIVIEQSYMPLDDLLDELQRAWSIYTGARSTNKGLTDTQGAEITTAARFLSSLVSNSQLVKNKLNRLIDDMRQLALYRVQALGWNPPCAPGEERCAMQGPKRGWY